jgi:hypothetical protein
VVPSLLHFGYGQLIALPLNLFFIFQFIFCLFVLTELHLFNQKLHLLAQCTILSFGEYRYLIRIFNLLETQGLNLSLSSEITSVTQGLNLFLSSEITSVTQGLNLFLSSEITSVTQGLNLSLSSEITSVTQVLNTYFYLINHCIQIFSFTNLK